MIRAFNSLYGYGLHKIVLTKKSPDVYQDFTLYVFDCLSTTLTKALLFFHKRKKRRKGF
jgi:hypothetical protein